jgi:hypothetical protein
LNVRENVIELLELALGAARKGYELTEVGRLLSKASEAAGVPRNIHELAREVRAKGFDIQADLVNLAVEVASTVDTKGEVYEHSLIGIHDLSCDLLDEIHGTGEPHDKGEKEADRVISRLN